MRIPALVACSLITAASFAGDAPATPRPRPSTWAQPMIGGGPGNFYRVSAVLYRSEQPEDEDMKTLAAMGMRSVLCLREYHDDVGEAKGVALKLLRVPLGAGKLDADGLKRALDALRSAEKPVLVHCWHGSDRTGAVVALWRMIEEGWSREAAIDEFAHGGYGYHQDWFPQIVDLLKNIELEPLRAAKP